LQRARDEGFDVFVTADQNLEYQQNRAGTEVQAIVLCARTNRLPDLLPLVPALLQALESKARGSVIHLR